MIARMDGGSIYKPVLHLGLVPLSQANLAESIKLRLGMAVDMKDDLRVVKEPQQSEIVQSTSSAAPRRIMPRPNSLAANSGLFLLLVFIVSSRNAFH